MDLETFVMNKNYNALSEIIKSISPDQINNIKNNGWNSFQLACAFSSFDIVKLLVENGADYNKKNAFGDTPLYIAIVYKKMDIIKYLFTLDNLDYYSKNKNHYNIEKYIENNYSFSYIRDVSKLLNEYISRIIKQLLDPYLCDDLIRLVVKKV